MDLLLRRHFWAVPVLCVILCAYLAGSAVNPVLAAELASAPPPRPAKKTPKREPAPKPQKDAEAVIARNMFCSTCEPGKPVEAPRDDGQPAVSSLPLVLVATMREQDGW